MSSWHDTPEWKEAAAHGCDMLLLEANLKRTPQERIQFHRRNVAIIESLESKGFIILSKVIDSSVIENLKRAMEVPAGAALSRRNSVYGARNLLKDCPAIRELADSIELRSIVTPILSGKAHPVRCLFFDKTADANWPVPWHQDLNIAVRERRDIEGFGPWTVKAGVPHVQPPRSILEKMLTVRIHLDDCDENNGPLQVIAGSHQSGILPTEQIQQQIASQSPVACHVPAGGAMLMKPLLLHSSARALQPTHRRVIHLEYADAKLPDGLDWHA